MMYCIFQCDLARQQVTQPFFEADLVSVTFNNLLTDEGVNYHG